ncbi:MAG: hypothetical protein NZ528_10905 [Caldilineales bacterium]|nr:hypothetical protein [Caldilineales bacterium]
MTPVDAPSAHPLIRASEVGEYAYCARAWWLRRVQGVPSTNVEALQAGRQAHSRHGRRVAAAQRQQRWAWLLAAAAMLLALTATALALGGW